MAVVRNLETEVEDALIAVLGASTDITTRAAVRKWRDGSNAESYPVTLVHCSPIGNDPATHRGGLYIANVEVGVQTDTPSDKTQSVLQAILGAVRDVLLASDLITSLNAVTGVDLTFLDRGIEIESGEYSIDEADEINQTSLTLVCHVSRIVE